MKFVTWLIVNAAALGVAAWLINGIELTGTSTSDKAVTLLIVGAIFGVINSVVRPIVKMLSLPLIILSLGLMLLVINALMLLLTSKVADSLSLGFSVDGFWTAVLGSVVISLAGMVVESLLPE